MENKTGQPEIMERNLKWQGQGDCRKMILRVVHAVKCLLHEIKGKDIGVNWQQTFELVVSTDHTLNAGINYPALSFSTYCNKKCFQ
jgi:hypothetical protein